MLSLLRSIWPRQSILMEPLIAVVGATGTGKSQLAVDLASRFNGEIINGDAMQMYRGLPIITNQITPDEQNGIPHHLLSCVELEEEAWRVGKFKKEALQLIQDIRSRGKLPILVGGTHYYTQAVLFKDQLVGEGANEELEANAVEGRSSRSTAEKWPILDASPEVMMAKLQEVDPVMAARWHPRDGRKIRRSLEIYFETGRPASEIYAEQKALKKDAQTKDAGLLRFSNTLIFWVHADKETLNSRLDARVDNMIEQGLMEEAQRMSDYIRSKESQGIEVDQTRGVWVSIGFKELAPYFAAIREGENDQDRLEKQKREAIESIQTATRQYGKTQVKWIKNKLWRALSEAGMTHRLYLLDSTDVSNWSECVLKPSESLVQSLLQGGPTPDPKSLSSLANDVLGTNEEKTKSKPGALLQCFTCDVCNKTLATDDQWNIHINSHSHKRALKSRAKKTQRDIYLQQKALESQKAPAAEAGP